MGEYLECNGCHATFDGDAYITAEPDDYFEHLPVWDDEGVACPICLEYNGFVRRGPNRGSDRQLVARWGPAGAKFVALPEVLVKHAGELGLTTRDLAILQQLESFRRRRDTPIFPSHATLARSLGVDQRTVRRWLGDLERRGLIETEPRRRADGTRTSNCYRLDGVTKVAELAHANKEGGLDVRAGLPQLLEELRNPSPPPQDKPVQASGQAGGTKVSEEAEELVTQKTNEIDAGNKPGGIEVDSGRFAGGALGEELHSAALLDWDTKGAS